MLWLSSSTQFLIKPRSVLRKTVIYTRFTGSASVVIAALPVQVLQSALQVEFLGTIHFLLLNINMALIDVPLFLTFNKCGDVI